MGGGVTEWQQKTQAGEKEKCYDKRDCVLRIQYPTVKMRHRHCTIEYRQHWVFVVHS